MSNFKANEVAIRKWAEAGEDPAHLISWWVGANPFFDGDYDTYIAKYAENCTDEELDIIRDSDEWKSSELEEYLELRDKYDM